MLSFISQGIAIKKIATHLRISISTLRAKFKVQSSKFKVQSNWKGYKLGWKRTHAYFAPMLSK